LTSRGQAAAEKSGENPGKGRFAPLQQKDHHDGMSGIFGNELEQRLKAAATLLERGEGRAAGQLLEPLLAWRPSADLLLLAGKAKLLERDPAAAEALFRRALALAPRRIPVLLALGGALRRLGRPGEAAGCYREATRLEHANGEAWLGRAEALREAGDLAGAERAYREVLRLKPDHLTARHELGLLMNRTGRAEQGETMLRSALSQAADPRQKAVVEHALGVCFLRQRKLEEALAHLDNARRLDPALAGIDLDRATVLQQLYRDEEAVAILKALVEREPSNMDAHNELNKLLYCLRRDAEFLASYDRAAARLPGRCEPLLAKARFLVAAERFAEARDVFAFVKKNHPANRFAANGLLIALSQLEAFDAALTEGEAAMRLFPDDTDIRATVAAALLRAAEPARAEKLIAETLARDPDSQVCLSLQGLAWRAQGDGRDDAFTGYEEHVRIFDIEPPPGFADMQSFNAQLDAALDALHPGRREYVDQSLRHGSQTTGDIFGAGHELVELLKNRIAETVRRYIAEMPGDAVHPLTRRRQRGFDFLGSWSSRLRDQGFHTSHIHAQGWISSCYYVALPDAVGDEAGRQGWIEFGRPSFKLDLKEPVKRSIQPRAGQLILFPSYMLHGTVPFRSAQDRTTIAFDVVPRA
jgi:tetratricopeptide (TPR) repeat protein